ncbi:DUF3352 domain-containing protein [Thermoflexus sp.]|uniref:DUF3352 domain-containing protein n=1 Tax=Thermoflexus sp. TaxID=1969742 RepID=UPI00262A2FD9|nr:DUF3352 domain-containing protein [Thermoflexus sp.]MCX7691201.1 DUF3352 domain-containing protein [Thermoflexus sp.]
MSRRWILLLLIPLALFSCCAAGVAVGALAFPQLRDRVTAMLGLRQQTLATELIPADAVFYMSLSYNLQAQPGYETIRKAYLDNAEVKRALEDFRARLKEEAKIDWEADVASWLGTEAGIAILALSPEALEQGRFPLVILIASRNLQASERFLQRLRELAAEQGPAFEERTYRRTRYWFRPGQQENEPPVLMATVRDFVVFAADEQALRAVVDRAEGQGQALARADRFQRVMKELPSQAVLLGYGDYNGLLRVLREALARQPEAPPLEELLGTGPSAELAKAIEAVGFSGELLPEGLRIQAISLIQRDKLSAEAQSALDVPPISEGMLAGVPERVLAILQIPRIGDQLKQSLEALRSVPDAEQQLRSIESALGIDLERDLISWMTGDLVLIVQPVQTATPLGVPVGVSALIEADRPQEAQTGLERLEALLQTVGLTVEDRELEGRSIRVIVDPSGTPVVGYAFGPRAVGIGLPPEALASSHPERGPERTIRDNRRFQEVLRRLPDRRSQLLFVDAQELWNLIEDQIPSAEREAFRRDVRPFLVPIRGIGIAGEALSGSAVQRGVFFVQITPP